MVAVGTNWEWEIPVGLGDVSDRILESSKHEVVVWVYGPGYSNYRRFQAEQGDAVQLRIEPVRQISSPTGIEGWTSPMSVQDHSLDMPILTRSGVGTIGVGGDRAGGSIEEENRSCDPFSSASYDVWGGEEWLDRDLLSMFD